MARQIVFFAVLLLIQTAVYAYRPFMTEDAGIAQLGDQKVELGLIENRQASYWYNYISFLYGIGLGRAEIQVETPYCTRGESQGLENVILGVKINVLGIDEETGLISIKVGYEFPDDCYGVSAVVTKKRMRYLIHWQVGLKRHYGDTIALFGLGIDYQFLQYFNIILDNFAEYEFNTFYHRIMLGLIHTINHASTVDMAVGYCYALSYTNYREFEIVSGISFAY
ncbi:MAG: hypothetical protein ACUVRK_03070 [Spirochaetota bacterium]